MKRFKLIALCLLAAVVVAVGIFALPIGARAAETYGTCGDHLTWILDDDGVLTISGSGDMYDFYDPLDVPWYAYKDGITSVVIQPGATGVGEYAFYYCTNLTSVTIPDGVTYINNSAFHSCYNLRSLTVPAGLTFIGDYAFQRCIGLAEVTLPASVTSIGNSAFYYCTGLETVYYGGSQYQWSAIAIGEYNTPLTDATIHYNHIHDWDSVSPVTVAPACTEDGYTEYICVHGESYREILPALGHAAGSDPVVTPPSCTEEGYTTSTCPRCGEQVKDQFVPMVEHTYVDHICSVCGDAEAQYSGTFSFGLLWKLDYAGNLTISGSGYMSGSYDAITIPWFDYRDAITSVEIENGITSVGAYVFYGCENLAEVTIPQSVTTIGENAFYGCASLIAITIPGSVKTIAAYAFDGCTGLGNVYYEGTQAQWERISVGTNNTPLTDAIIHFSLVQEYTGSCGENLTWALDTAGTLTISGTGAMTDYAIAKPGVTGNPAPWYDIASTVKAVEIGEGVTDIGEAAFYGCSNLTTITIPNSVTDIGADAFRNCGLTSVTIPDSVTSIGDFAFGVCSRMSTVSIGDSVTSIGERVFYLCYGLREIRVDANNPSYSSDDSGVLFNKNKTTLVQAPNGLSGSYTIPNSVTTIGEEAFYGCSSLRAVTLGSRVSAIDSTAFSGCTGLTQISVNASNATYSSDDSGVLFNKNKTTLILAPGGLSGSYTIPEGVTVINEYAFYSCAGLTTITIPGSLEYIGDSAFSGRDRFQRVSYMGTQEQWSSVQIGYDNYRLTAATIQYHTHSYTTDPITCNTCGHKRVKMAITTVTLRPSRAALYFKGEFTFDQDVQVTRYGITVSLYNPNPVADRTDTTSRYTVSTKSALITDILTGNAAANAQRPVYARAYAVLSNGRTVYSDAVSVSLQQLVEAVDRAYTNLNATQKTALSVMYGRNTAVMSNWNIPNIKKSV